MTDLCGAGLVLALRGDFITTFWQVVALITGMIVGSFLNVVIWRLPLGMSLSRPPSACPGCGTRIRWFDNVPVLSWLALRARCRSCKTPISARYPFVEALTGVLFLLAAIEYEGDPVTIVAVSLTLAALVAISFIDLDHRIIPDVISLPGIAAGIASAPFLALTPLHHPDGFVVPGIPWLDAVLCACAGAAAGAFVIQLVRVFGSYVLRKEAMGFGDVKLLAMIGAFVGPVWVLYALVLACFAGALIGGIAYLVSRRRALPCEGTVRLHDGTACAFERVRVRDEDLLFTGAAPGASGARVGVDMVLPAHRALTDEDVAATFEGVIATVDPDRFTVALDGPFQSPDHEAAFAALDAFSEPRRSARARLFLVLGLALGGSALIAIFFGQPLLLRASGVAAMLCLALAWLRRGRARPCQIEARLSGKGAKDKHVVRADEAQLDEGVLVFEADRGAKAKARVTLDITFPGATVGELDDVQVVATGRIADVRERDGGGHTWHVLLDAGFESDDVAEAYETLAIFGQSARYIPFGPFLSIAGAAMLLFGQDVAWFIAVRYPEWTRSLLD